jgi:programmed cell death protein 5
MQQRERELQRQRLLRSLLELTARKRLTRVSLANPELTQRIENLLLSLYQAGNLNGMVTDAQLVEILGRMSAKRQTRITRK